MLPSFNGVLMRAGLMRAALSLGCRWLPWLTFPAIAVLVLAPVAFSLPGSAALAVELSGSTLFVKAPWQVGLISYSTTVGQPLPEHYFTLELDPGAGASLAGFTFQQIRGADRQFPFALERTRAFLGRPRHEGPSVPVMARFNDDTRTMTLEFPEPIPPGNTVTVSVVPWTNPMQSDTYLFQVEAYPSGPNPVASPVGIGTLRIYQNTYW